VEPRTIILGALLNLSIVLRNAGLKVLIRDLKNSAVSSCKADFNVTECQQTYSHHEQKHQHEWPQRHCYDDQPTYKQLQEERAVHFYATTLLLAASFACTCTVSCLALAAGSLFYQDRHSTFETPLDGVLPSMIALFFVAYNIASQILLTEVSLVIHSLLELGKRLTIMILAYFLTGYVP
jgi:hypothetical protein